MLLHRIKYERYAIGEPKQNLPHIKKTHAIMLHRFEYIYM